jgi:acyl carrier protein
MGFSTMDKFDAIKEIVFTAIDEVNQQSLKEIQVQKTIETPLTGGASLDSMALVNLILSIEDKVEKEFGVSISLFDELASSSEDDPFENVKSVIDYILLLLNEHNY